MRLKTVLSTLATLAVAAAVVPGANAVAHEEERSRERWSWSATDTYRVVAADNTGDPDWELKEDAQVSAPATGDYSLRIDDDNEDVAKVNAWYRSARPDQDGVRKRIEVFNGCMRSGESVPLFALTPVRLTVSVDPGNDCSSPTVDFLLVYFNAQSRPSEGTVTLSWRPEGHLDRLYRAALLREPDEGGFDYWLNRLEEGGASLEDVADAFGDSAEFRQHYDGLDTAEFVDRAHLNVFGRHPDTGDRHQWIHELRDHQLTRARLVLQFADSPAFRGLTPSR